MGTLRGAATSWRTRSTSSKRVEGRPLASDKGETALPSAAALWGIDGPTLTELPPGTESGPGSVLCVFTLRQVCQSSLL